MTQPLSGHVYDAEWLQYDKTNKEFLTPVKIKLKGFSGIGISTGIRESVSVQNASGRWTTKQTVKVHVVEDYDFEVGDIIRFDEKQYVIARIADDMNHPNALGNLMFKNYSNTPKILYLGDD